MYICHNSKIAFLFYRQGPGCTANEESLEHNFAADFPNTKINHNSSNYQEYIKQLKQGFFQNISINRSNSAFSDLAKINTDVADRRVKIRRRIHKTCDNIFTVSEYATQIQSWSCCCALGKGFLRLFSFLGGTTSRTKFQSYNKKDYLDNNISVSLCIASPSLSCKPGG